MPIMDPKPLTAHLPPDSKAGTHDPLQRLVDKVRFAFTKSETPKIVHNSPIKQLFALDHGIKISRSTGPHAAQSQSCMLRDLGSALTSEGPTLATQPTGAMSPDSLRGWSAEASTSPAKQVRLATRWSPEKVNTPPRTPLQVRATPKIIDRPAAVARSSRQGATAVGGAVGLLRRILSPSKILFTDDEGAAPLYTRCSSMLAFEGGDAEPPSLTRLALLAFDRSRNITLGTFGAQCQFESGGGCRLSGSDDIRPIISGTHGPVPHRLIDVLTNDLGVHAPHYIR